MDGPSDLDLTDSPSPRINEERVDCDDPRIARLEDELAAALDELARWRLLGAELRRRVYDIPPDLRFELRELEATAHLPE
jgi:hypothetical protein